MDLRDKLIGFSLGVSMLASLVGCSNEIIEYDGMTSYGETVVTRSYDGTMRCRRTIDVRNGDNSYHIVNYDVKHGEFLSEKFAEMYDSIMKEVEDSLKTKLD